MDICIFAKYLPVHIIGGMEIHICDLVNCLIKRGHQVSIITSRHPEGLKKEEKGDLTIYYVDGEAWYIKKWRYNRNALKLFKNLINHKKFDVVHCQSFEGYGVVSRYGQHIPLVVTSHGTSFNEIRTILAGREKLKSYLGLPFWMKYYLVDERVIFQRSDRVIAVSNELKKDIKRQYKTPEEKLVVIPNGIDINKFKPMGVDDLKKKWGLTDERIIVSVGKINKQKGFHLLLKILPEVLKEIKDIKLVIVGSGSYLQELKKMAMRLNIFDNVIFTGRVSEEALPHYYNLADVCVFSTLRMEGLPLVVPEAMACAKPVIASKIGGIPTAIENNKNGILIEPGNAKELQEQILKVLSDEELARELGENARKKVVEMMSLDRMVDDTIKVYEGLL